MTNRDTFNALLVRIGFNTITADEIINKGFDEISVLGEMEDKDIDKLIFHIGRWQGPRAPTHEPTDVLMALPHSRSLYTF